MMANFVQKFKDREINGVSMELVAAQIHHMTLEEYMEDIILRINVNAVTLVFSIAPLVLRINISSYIFDPYNEEAVTFYIFVE